MSPYPVGSGGRHRITTVGAFHPVWVQKGREIVFLSLAFGGSPVRGTGPGLGVAGLATQVAVHALPIVTEPALTRRNPVQLFRPSPVDGLFLIEGGKRNYDVSSDGQRLVVPSLNQTGSSDGQAATPLRIHVVLNWFEEIKARVPAP